MAVDLAHPWRDLVLDGVGDPRVMILGDEICTNQSFETGLDDWEEFGGTNAMSRYEDSSTFYGSYVLKVEDDSPGEVEVAWHVNNVGEVAGRKFVFTLFYKSATGHTHQFSILTHANLSGIQVSDFVASADEWRLCVIVREFVNDQSSVTVEIVPYKFSLGNAGMGSVYIDNVSIREITDDFVLPCPKTFLQRFDKEILVKNKLIDGTIKTYIDGWRYKCRIGYEYLGKAQEYIRRKLAQETNDLMIFPHRDIDNCIMVSWDGNYLQKYFKNKYLGHEGIFAFEGIQLAGQLLGAVEFGGFIIDDSEFVYGAAGAEKAGGGVS